MTRASCFRPTDKSSTWSSSSSRSRSELPLVSLCWWSLPGAGEGVRLLCRMYFMKPGLGLGLRAFEEVGLEARAEAAWAAAAAAIAAKASLSSPVILKKGVLDKFS